MSEVSIKFIYKFDSEYNPVYTNGAYGGATPNGEIVINYYLERQPIPYTEVKTVNVNNGELLESSIVEPVEHNENVVRYVSTGVVMNLKTAKEIHEWLGMHISQLELEGGGS
ncbi:hypothetical protein FZW96_07850 [Bacillus sp. BGMRC 2118]|nr:hypothetical protein FZW96_07850 [Bacillus sp. BGMRC 2118]